MFKREIEREVNKSSTENLASVHKDKSLQVIYIVIATIQNKCMWRFGREYTITRNPKSIGTADTF